MADNFLEYHREEYELRKARWLAKKNGKPVPKAVKRQIPRPENEAL